MRMRRSQQDLLTTYDGGADRRFFSFAAREIEDGVCMFHDSL